MRVSPRIFGLIFMGSMLSIYSSSCVLYSAGSGVKRVHVVLSGLRMRLFVRVHVCISCRYDWMFAFTNSFHLYVLFFSLTRVRHDTLVSNSSTYKSLHTSLHSIHASMHSLNMNLSQENIHSNGNIDEKFSCSESMMSRNRTYSNKSNGLHGTKEKHKLIDEEKAEIGNVSNAYTSAI